MYREIQQVVNVSDKSAIDEMEEKFCDWVTQKKKEKAVQSGYSTSIIIIIIE